MTNDILRNIGKLYNSSSKPKINTGGDYFISILIIIVLVLIIVFQMYKNEFKIVDKEWDKYRCHPKYVFIGGLIHKDPDMDRMTYNAANVAHCMSSVTGDALNNSVKKMNKLRDLDTSRAMSFENSLDAIHGSFKSITSYTAMVTMTIQNLYSNLLGGSTDDSTIVLELLKKLGVYMDQVKVNMQYLKTYLYAIFGILVKHHESKQNSYENRWGRNSFGRFFTRGLYSKSINKHKDAKNQAQKFRSNLN